MKRIYILLVLSILSCVLANAQENTTDTLVVSGDVTVTESIDAEDLRRLSMSYYDLQNTLARNYNFELYNKERRLRMWSNEVKVFGCASMLGVLFGGAWLFPDASLWVLIPAEVVIGAGLVYGSLMWANHLEKKADAIRQSSVPLININENSKLQITHYSTDTNQNVGFGISYKHNF